MVDVKRLPSPNDLLILLTVARLGRFNAVAEALGTTHTTISRRILALDEEVLRDSHREPQRKHPVASRAAAVAQAVPAPGAPGGRVTGVITPKSQTP